MLRVRLNSGHRTVALNSNGLKFLDTCDLFTLASVSEPLISSRIEDNFIDVFYNKF
jgi:hypothetical protein